MIVTSGSTNVTLYVYFVDDVSGTATGEPTTGLLFSNIETGGSASYVRQGEARTDFELFTQTVAGAHTDGGFVLVDDTNMPGLYRLDVPDTAFATGFDWVIIQLVAASGNDTVMRPVWIDLLEVDLREANGRVDVGSWLGNTVATPTINGVPEVDITHQVGTLVPTPSTAGIPDVNVREWLDTGVAAATSGIPDINAVRWNNGLIPAQGITGVPEVDVTHIVAGLVPTPTTTGVPDVNVERWLDTLVTLGSGAPDVNVQSMDAGTVTATSVATDAIDADALATDAAEEIADTVWDEIITGAFHNTVNSAGRRLRQLAEAGSYSGGQVFIDTVNGTAGTTDFENGAEVLPCLTIADANTIAGSVGLSRFAVAPASSLTFVASQVNQEFNGENWTLALGGQAIDGSHFDGADISGTGTCATEAHFEHCELGAMTIGVAHFDECDLEGTVTLSDAAIYRFLGCFHSGTAVIDFGAAVANTTVHIHHYNGALTIENLGANGTDVLHFDSPGGQLTLAASCVGGTVNFRGTAALVNNGSGITINRGGDVVNDVAGVQSDTDDIQTRLPAALVGGAMDSDVSAMQSGTITATVIATDAIDADALATDAVNEIADGVKGRQLTETYNTDGTAPTLEEALMAILQQAGEFAIAGTTITVKKLDGSTTAMTFTLDNATNPTSRTRAS